MQNAIYNIFHNNIQILNDADKSINYLRKQNYNKGLHYYKSMINKIMNVVEELIACIDYFNIVDENINVARINSLLQNILETQENKDFILLADSLELMLIPFIRNLQEIIMNGEDVLFYEEVFYNNLKLMNDIDKNFKDKLEKAGPMEGAFDDYLVEYTSNGLLTLAKLQDNQKFYYHSNLNPLKEAAMLAEEWYSKDKSEYNLYGLGLGYHVMELVDIDENVIIHVYESDWNVIRFAFTFSNLSELLASKRVYIHYDPTFDQLNSRLKNSDEKTSFIMHYPSIRSIQDIPIKQQMEDYFILYSSIKNQSIYMDSNFRENSQYSNSPVDVLEDKFAGKDLYIIAAGPSLDVNYKELKKVGKKGIILATGTVLKKLIDNGIRPDYVIITDANTAVYRQIEGIENIDIPLLYLSTAYHKVVKSYKGEKYFICQKDYNHSEEIARLKGYRLYNTGGSVSTTALDIGISFGCKRIIFVGLDLAFTNNLDHATGTPVRRLISTSDRRKVEDIHGELVSTGKNLDIYRKWIEKRIKDEKDILFIDATEGGAKIKGTIIKKLSEVLH
ncbi:MAG: motility associated factor glycosyltransferase family protein [Bacteroidales bacterium]|nr:motility associated factor glycosyltransferase family protein [Bacteroidales bacterium]